MDRCIRIVLLSLCLSWIAGCHQEKSLGPLPVFPENGTRLYFIECEPLQIYPTVRDNVTLSANAEDACGQNIEFGAFSAFSWRGNYFTPYSGTIREGYHLVFIRSVAEAANPGTVAVQFHGLAVNFYREITLPVGETIVAVDGIESGVVTDVPDTARYIGIYIRSISDTFRLRTSFSEGSYLYTEADRNSLCEFTVSLGLAQGIGSPNGGVNFIYEHAASSVEAAFLRDFTRGAWVENTFIHFGPRYGACYLTATAGECCDTAVFWAPAPAQGYRTNVLGTFNGWVPLLSDGDDVWMYGTSWLQQVTGPRREVRITNTNDVLLISHFIWDSIGSVRLAYDRLNHLIWIVERFADQADTAWGYSPAGDLDSIIVSENIPFGTVRQGRWVIEYGRDDYIRVIATVPLSGGTPAFLREYPTDLTNNFAGEAGFAYPGVAGADSWSLNIFDSDANWIARYPITGGASESVDHVGILMTDEVVVYAVYTWDLSSAAINTRLYSLRSD